MKRNRKYRLQLALAACLAIPAGAALAADTTTDAPDTSNWVCKFCVVPYGWYGGADFGLVYVDDPTPKFADYRGLDDDGFTLDLGGEGGYRGENGHYVEYYAKNLALDSRILDAEAGKQGTYDFRGSYQEIPRYLGHGTMTPFEGVGSDTLTLPTGWAAGGPMEYAALESNRTIGGAGFTFKGLDKWRFDVDFERQEKDGTKSFSGGVFYVNAVLFPSPLNYSTDRFDASVEYTGKMLQLRAEYMGSEFDNGYSSVTWDNPLALGFGDDISRTALEPGNEFQQFSLVGAIRFTDWLKLTGKFSSGEGKQNDAFLPYSINPNFADRPLPRESLNGKLETSMYRLAGRLYVKISKGLDLTASYKASERDNKTPIDLYEPVMFEIDEQGPRRNRPYGYDRSRGDVELRWRASYQLRLNAGYVMEEIERSYQQVLKTDEDGYFGEVQWTPLAMLDMRLRYEDLSRDASPSEQQGNYGRAENPLMRKYNMADRDRQRLTAQLDVTPMDRVGVSFSVWSTDDSYDQSVIGLNDSEEKAISFDFNYLFDSGSSIYAFFTQETIEARMSAANGDGATPWNGFTEDEILSWGFGFSGQFKEKWTWGFDYVYSDSEGDIQVIDGGSGTPFPTLTTELENIRLYVDYDVNDHWGIGLELYNESYDTSDWLVDGVDPYTIEGIFTMGEESPDYDVNVFRVLARYRF